MSFADLILLEVVAASLVDSHLARLTAVTLATESPNTILTFVAECHLKSLGDKGVAIDPTDLLPPSGSTTLVNTHCVCEIAFRNSHMIARTGYKKLTKARGKKTFPLV